jgi:hypothetical protein
LVRNEKGTFDARPEEPVRPLGEISAPQGRTFSSGLH